MEISNDEITYYKNKFGRDIKVIDTAKKAYDAIDSAKDLNREENFAAVVFTLMMLKNNDKTMFDNKT